MGKYVVTCTKDEKGNINITESGEEFTPFEMLGLLVHVLNRKSMQLEQSSSQSGKTFSEKVKEEAKQRNLKRLTGNK